MSHSHPAGLLATYNSLTDKHLAGYFNNTRIRRHLLRSGLITRSGRILSEKEYRVNIMKQDQQKYIRECLARAIFHKVLDMERHHQLEIKKKLDTLARKEQIQRLKGEHTRRFVEDNTPILTPHPPAGPKTHRGHSVLAEEGYSSPLALTAPRPYTAPGKMQPPIRLQPLLSHRTTRNSSKITSGSKPKASLLDAPFPIGGKKAMMKFRNYMDYSQREERYQLPNIHSYQIPVHLTPQPQTAKNFRESRLEPWRRKKLRPITAPNGLEPLFTRDPGRIYKIAPHSNAVITMAYFGKNVHLSYEDTDFRDEIKIYQQHCGGENLCVYSGKLLEKDTFQFISKRHHGFPFSLTFFLNGIQVNRLSSCCEYKHRRSSRLGGKRGYFGFVCVEKASPCYRCILAMGLDRKPTSSVKCRKERTTEKKEESPKRSQGKLRKDRDHMTSRRSELEGKETSISAVCSVEEIKSGVGDVRTAIEEMEWKDKEEQEEWEDDQESTVKYEYEEDFEIDEEKPDEGADDQMSVTSKSPSEDENDNVIPEQAMGSSSGLALDASAGGDHKDDECPDSEDDKQDVKTISPTSSRSHPYSSESEDELTEAGVEARSGTSAGSSQTSSSHDLQEHDQKKPHFPGEESLEAEIEEQEITKTDADKEPLSTEASYTHITEEEPVKETQEFTKSENENFRQPASPEANAKSPLQGEGAAMEEDRKAGLLEVEEEVGQIAGDAQAPVHDRSNAASGFSTAEGRVMAMRKPEAPLDRVEKEGRAMSSNEHPKQAAHEVCTLKEEAMEKDGFSQSGDADFYVGLKEEAGMEGGDAYHTQDADMNVGLREEAHVADVPLGERSPTGEQPAPAKESTGRVEHFLSIDNEAEAGTEGSSRLREEQLMPTGKVAAGSSVFLTVDQTLDRQRDVDSTRKALLQTAMEKEQPVSEGEQELEEAALTDSTKLSPGTLGDTAVLKEAGLSEVEAERKVGSSKQVEEQSKEGALTELEGMGSIADTAPEREDSSEVEILGGHKAAMEREDVLEAEAPLSSSRGEVWANPREVCQGNHEGLCKADIAREGVIADTELTLQQDLQAVLPGELAAAGDMEKAERPPVPLRETGSEREEVTEATVLKPEDLLKEQKAEGEEEGTEVSFEKEARASPDERKADAQEAESTSTTELGEATRLLGEPPKQEIVALLEATLHLGKPLEESEATEYKRQEGLPSQQSEAMSQPFRVPNHDGEGLIEAPGPEPADKALPPESFSTAGSEEWPSEELDSHAEVERLDGGRPLQVQGGDIMKVTQGNLLEERLTKAGLFSREAEGAKLQEEQDGARESPPGTQPDSLTGQSGAMGGDTVEAEEGLQTGGLEETAAAQGMVSTESESAGGDSEASSSADARKETWGTAGETPGESAAEERAVAEDMAPGTTKEKAREVQDSRPGKGREAGDTEAFQHAGTAGEEAGTRLLDAGQQAGAAEVFRGSVSQRALELSRACLEAAPPRKLDFSRTQQNPLEKLQGEHEGADIPVTTAE
ncbi:glutamate-rich protein 3 isoform X2 [Meriones unguiculatus]|uniref:glutamate-rich protein 3 isoform X2 n=1 Tax=Meriones unguiculatus TaxID=10047 RepID=UPI00293E5D20|nr:glutamate-rich protein 3 isoform X2 [Meriones unguiculatus]